MCQLRLKCTGMSNVPYLTHYNEKLHSTLLSLTYDRHCTFWYAIAPTLPRHITSWLPVAARAQTREPCRLHSRVTRHDRPSPCPRLHIYAHSGARRPPCPMRAMSAMSHARHVPDSMYQGSVSMYQRAKTPCPTAQSPCTMSIWPSCYATWNIKY